jgi:hypothetical protein
MEWIAGAFVGMVIGIAASNGALRPSRLKRTLAHMWRTEWREFNDIKAWLVERGYSLTRDEKYPMSSATADLHKDGTFISIDSDRGFWAVSAGPSARPDELHVLDAWALCLDTPEAEFRDDPGHWWLDLRLQLGYLRGHIEAIERACAVESRADTLKCLGDARRSIDSRDIRRR